MIIHVRLASMRERLGFSSVSAWGMRRFSLPFLWLPSGGFVVHEGVFTRRRSSPYWLTRLLGKAYPDRAMKQDQCYHAPVHAPVLLSMVRPDQISRPVSSWSLASAGVGGGMGLRGRGRKMGVLLLLGGLRRA